MPESPEIRIMSDYINSQSKDKIYQKFYHVEKGNVQTDSNLIENFNVSSDFNGKELTLKFSNLEKSVNISVFMGMSGNWKFVSNSIWNETNHVRMRIVSGEDSLILYGGYMGPKYKVGNFSGVKRGPDIIKNFDAFKQNVLRDINKLVFDKPICEVLLNQKYFNGVGNYIRSTVIYYLDIDPFQPARNVLQNANIFDMCRFVIEKSYELNGGQLKDWKNPFNKNSNDFQKWVFYKKGVSCKDATGRTFWFSEKWKDNCPY